MQWELRQTPYPSCCSLHPVCPLSHTVIHERTGGLDTCCSAHAMPQCWKPCPLLCPVPSAQARIRTRSPASPPPVPILSISPSSSVTCLAGAGKLLTTFQVSGSPRDPQSHGWGRTSPDLTHSLCQGAPNPCCAASKDSRAGTGAGDGSIVLIQWKEQ